MTVQAEHPGVHGPDEVSPGTRRHVLVAGIILLLAAGLVVVLLYVHKRAVVRAQRSAMVDERARGLKVTVTRVTTTPAQRVVTLPADVDAYYQATLYAKVSGYVRDVRVQRGQRVKQGEVLATIYSPETEKDVATAQHENDIARVNAERANRLAPSGVVAVQDRDNFVASSRVAQAGLGRSIAILKYLVVRAPFDGIVSARYVDPGALLPATGATTGSLPIVDVSDVDRLRVFVYAGQDVAPFVRLGDQTLVWQDEIPDRRIPANVTFTTGALDPRTRTMQVEIDVDNTKWQLLPGTFAHVELHVAGTPSPLVPDEAIVIRDGKTMVVTIDDNHAHYVEVDLGYNDGSSVRVLRGLKGNETIGLDVPVQVQDGDAVQPTEAKAPGH